MSFFGKELAYYAVAGVPAAVYVARRTAIEPRSQELQLTWITAIACLVLIRNRAKLRSLAHGLPAFVYRGHGSRQEEEENESDDETMPQLKSLVQGSKVQPSPLSYDKIHFDNEYEEWEEDCPPRFARQRIQEAAFIWCRHDLDICTRTSYTKSNRTWDCDIGSVPLDTAKRWQQQQQYQHSKNTILTDRAANDLPPPRIPHSVHFSFTSPSASSVE